VDLTFETNGQCDVIGIHPGDEICAGQAPRFIESPDDSGIRATDHADPAVPCGKAVEDRSVPSVDPSSTIKNSKSVNVWARILSMASATYRSQLYTGRATRKTEKDSLILSAEFPSIGPVECLFAA